MSISDPALASDAGNSGIPFSPNRSGPGQDTGSRAVDPSLNPPLPALNEAETAALDDLAAAAAHTEWVETPGRPRLARTRLLFDGMHCAACAGLIEHAAARVPGVEAVQVNGATRRGVLTWDPARTRASDWVNAIRAAGYQAFPDAGATAVEMHRTEARKAMWRLFVAGFCMMQVMMYATPSYVAAPGDMSPDLAQLLRWASWVLSIPVLLFSAGPFFQGAWRALRQRRIGMDVPVALGIAVTFVASTGATFDPKGVFGEEVYFDSMTMFVAFLLAGRYLELWARARTAQALDAVLRRLPDSVERQDPDGVFRRVAVGRLAVGDRIRIAAGQAFAADGLLLEGRTEVDESLLSGESRPVTRGEGDPVVAGSLNLGAPVTMRVEGLGVDTHYHRIVELMQRAVDDKPALMRAADRIAGPFLWGVLILAAVAAAVWHTIEPGRAIWVAVSVLIVTCPCALSLAAPSAMLAAAGALARRGVLVQRLDALEALAQSDTVIFDKTGTLSHEKLGVASVHGLKPDGTEQPAPPEDHMAWRVARALAVRSQHPLSRAVAEEMRLRGGAAEAELKDIREVAGAGLEGRDASGQTWRLGAPAWVAPGVPVRGSRPAVWLARDGQVELAYEIDETLRPDAPTAVAGLQSQGLRVEMLSGDQDERVQSVARHLGVDQARSQARPQDKLDAVAQAQAQGRRVVGVGDGLNDAPWLARADVAFALGHGATLAQSRADFVLTGGELGGVAWARQQAVRAMRIVRQNMAWAVLYNLVCVPLAAVGWLPPWLAGLGMATSSLVVVLNALRLTRLPAPPKNVKPLASMRPAA